MIKYSYLSFVLVAVGASAVSSASVLLDCTSLNAYAGTLNTTHYTDTNTGWALANAVHVPTGGWSIDTISGFYSAIGDISDVTNADLIIVPYVAGTYPTLNPFTDPSVKQVAVTFTTEELSDTVNDTTRTAQRMDASGLNLSLATGDYWISLLPRSTSASLMAWGAQDTLLSTPAWYSSNDGVWGAPYTFYTANSVAMRIQSVPEPGSFAVMGLGLCGLMFARRRAK